MSEIDTHQISLSLERIAKAQEKRVELAEVQLDQFEVLLNRIQAIENTLNEIEAKTLDVNKAVRERKYSSYYCTFEEDGRPRVWWPHYYEEPVDAGSYIKLIETEMLSVPIEERIAAGKNRAALNDYYMGYADDHDWAIVTYSWGQIGEISSTYDQIMTDGEDVPTPGIRAAHKKIIDEILELQVLKNDLSKFGRRER